MSQRGRVEGGNESTGVLIVGVVGTGGSTLGGVMQAGAESMGGFMEDGVMGSTPTLHGVGSMGWRVA